MRARFLVRRRRVIITSLAGVCVTLLLVKLFWIYSLDSVVRNQDSKPSKAFTMGSSLRQEIADRFARRRERLKAACSRLNVSNDNWGLRHPDHRFIFPTNSSPTVLYCPIPKTGTTFLKKTFAEANRMNKVIWIDRFFVRPVDDYDKAIMFFFTREPYSRMLSAYVDKLWSPNLHFWRVLGRDLVRRVRPEASTSALDCGHDVTFPEFVRYFIQGMIHNVHINTHLVPTHKFCQPCTYKYDFIGHLETFREDAPFILSTINVTSFGDVDNDDDIIMYHVIQAFYTEFFDRNKCQTKHKMLLRSWRALQIRGLISMSIAFPFSEPMTRFIGKDVFAKTVYGAVRKSEHLMQNSDSLYGQSTPRDESRATTPSQSAYLLTARAIQKRMALASAYSLVPMADKLKLIELLREEFELFGYEPKPSDVFSPGFPLNPKIFELSNI